MTVPTGPASEPAAAPAVTPVIPPAASPTWSATPGWSSCLPSALSLARSIRPSDESGVLSGLFMMNLGCEIRRDDRASSGPGTPGHIDQFTERGPTNSSCDLLRLSSRARSDWRCLGFGYRQLISD